jgi:predicted GNAT family acetyltransferase
MLTEWRIAYRQETMAEPLTPALIESSRESVQRMVSEKRTWLIESAGKVVACSSFNASVKSGIQGGVVQVGGVWTPPALRKNHYGRAAVATSLIAARNSGYTRAILFTDEENIPAQKAYTALGFKQIGTYGLSFLSKPLKLPT